MKHIIKNILVVITVAIVQTSMLPAIFPSMHVPNVALVFAIAWTILVGFPGVFGWIIALGIILDLLTFSRIGVNVIPLIILAYAASFLSRRFLVEEKGLGIAAAVMVTLVATVVYRAIFMFLEGITLSAIFNIKLELLRSIGWEITYNIAAFFICFYLVKKLYYGNIKDMQLSLSNIRRQA